MDMFRDTSAQDRVVESSTSPWIRRHRVLLVVVAGAVILLLLVSTNARWSAAPGVSARRLSIATVERGRFVRDIAAEGRIVAAVSPMLYAAAAGTVNFSVKAGDTVQRGDVLGTIKSPELQSELEQAQASLEEMTIAHKRAQLEARQQSQLADQEAQTALIERDSATNEHERMTKAFALGAIAEIEVKRTRTLLDKAEVNYTHVRNNRALRNDLLLFDVDAKRVARDRQSLVVQDLKRQIELLTLRSPVSGQAGQILVSDRAYVAKDTPLLTVVDLTALAVDISVPEGFARDLAVGMPAQIIAGGRELQGQVGAVSPEVVNGEVVARVRFADDATQGLRQSQRVSVRVLLDSRDDVLTVTRGPFMEIDGGRTAYVVHGGVAERRPIRVGASSVDKVEILAGVRAGEGIVISGAEKFNGAQRVFINE
jgi:HlyD family secretion protein